MLGVALGVVLLPSCRARRPPATPPVSPRCSTGGLRLVVLLALPAAMGLLLFAEPLVAVLYHYGRFTANDVQQTVLALSCYGVGLLGLIGVKVLAPGFYATQDIKTPVRIGIAVLVITQCLNAVFVPFLNHAGLALSIGLGSLVNATWLLIGLRRTGRYQPSSGWWLFALRVGVASAGAGCRPVAGRAPHRLDRAARAADGAHWRDGRLLGRRGGAVLRGAGAVRSEPAQGHPALTFSADDAPRCTSAAPAHVSERTRLMASPPARPGGWSGPRWAFLGALALGTTAMLKPSLAASLSRS